MILERDREMHIPIYQTSPHNKKNDSPPTERPHLLIREWLYLHPYFLSQQIPWLVPGSFWRCEKYISLFRQRVFSSRFFHMHSSPPSLPYRHRLRSPRLLPQFFPL